MPCGASGRRSVCLGEVISFAGLLIVPFFCPLRWSLCPCPPALSLCGSCCRLSDVRVMLYMCGVSLWSCVWFFDVLPCFSRFVLLQFHPTALFSCAGHCPVQQVAQFLVCLLWILSVHSPSFLCGHGCAYSLTPFLVAGGVRPLMSWSVICCRACLLV